MRFRKPDAFAPRQMLYTFHMAVHGCQLWHTPAPLSCTIRHLRLSLFSSPVSPKGVSASAGAEFDWFAHNPVVGARAGRPAAEFWRDAVARLREALTLRPAATELSYVLVQAGISTTHSALTSRGDHL